MPQHRVGLSRAGLESLKCFMSTFLFAAAITAFFAAAPTFALAAAQSIPEEAYGPYSAVFLADGSGLTKPLAPPSTHDPRAAEIVARFGIRSPEKPDPLLAGDAAWTLCFWFHPSEPLAGTALLAGIGDPSADDARFIGVKDNKLGLWLGKTESPGGMIAAPEAVPRQNSIRQRN